MGPEDMTLPSVMGFTPLREAIANYLNISRGLNCNADQIFVTSGYKNSVALILQTLSNKNDKVVFEDPGYFFGQKLLKRIVLNLHYNPVDSAGIDTDYFKMHHADAKFVFTTPSHHSPLAVTLSLPRRNLLLDWAKKNRSWIIEDDYDGEFHYTRKVIPALKSHDIYDRVIYVGTFSKTIMPSIRTSYIVVPRELISKFKETSEIIETSQPLLPQKILTLFLSEGHFFKHLKKMRSLYQKRRIMLINALEKVYPNLFDFELADGGMHVVAFLKKGTHDVKISNIWNDHNLLVIPLSAWYAQKNKRYGLVIGYTNITSEREAIEVLKTAYEQTIGLL
jgi:GntR family transcriptional regulator/MocR family aminotransferase